MYKHNKMSTLISTHATIEVYIYGIPFFPISFQKDRAFFLDPKSSGFRHIFGNDSRCVSTSSWDVSSGVLADFFVLSSPNQFFGRGLKLPN